MTNAPQPIKEYYSIHLASTVTLIDPQNTSNFSTLTEAAFNTLLDQEPFQGSNNISCGKISRIPENSNERKRYQKFLNFPKENNNPVYYKMLQRFPPAYRLYDKKTKNLMFFSKKEIHDGERAWIVGYSENPVKIFTYWKSNSESFWRFCPQTDRGNGRINKGEQIEGALYESTTKIDLVYHTYFEKFASTKPQGQNPRDAFQFIQEKHKEQGRPYPKDEMTDNPSLGRELEIIKLRPNSTKKSANQFLRGKTRKEVKKEMRTLSIPNKTIDINNMKIIGKSEGYHKELKKKTYHYQCETTYRGEKLHIIFSRCHDDNKVRIENAFFPDAGLTSHRVPKKQLNMGYLMMKPIDYGKQCTLDDKKHGNNYVDIRELYNEHPFMKRLSSLALQYDQMG